MTTKKLKHKEMENQTMSFKLSGVSIAYLVIYILTLFLLVKLLTGVGNATSNDSNKSKTELFGE